MKQLSCVAQKYAWGKVGKQSAVARLHFSNKGGDSVIPEEPFAELWMGAASIYLLKLINIYK